MTVSFTFNGIDFGTIGVEVNNKFKLVGATDAPYKPFGLPAASRVWYQRGECQPVAIDFPVRIQAASAAALIAELDTINAALVTNADAALSFSTFYADRYWLARHYGNALQMPILNSRTLETTIRFLAQPNMLANSLSTGSVSITANPQTVYIPGPLVGDGVVAGNTTVAPTLILRNTGTDIAAGALAIWNYTTGDYIAYTDSVPASTYVKFDCENRIAYTSPDGTTYTATSGKVLTNWLTLAGGAAARLIVDGVASAATLSWSYRGRYL